MSHCRKLFIQILHSNEVCIVVTLMFRFLQCDPGAVLILNLVWTHTPQCLIWLNIPRAFPIPIPKAIKALHSQLNAKMTSRNAHCSRFRSAITGLSAVSTEIMCRALPLLCTHWQTLTSRDTYSLKQQVVWQHIKGFFTQRKSCEIMCSIRKQDSVSLASRQQLACLSCLYKKIFFL